MFNMLSSLPQFRLPPKFPPQSVADPSNSNHGILSRPMGMVEMNELTEEDPGVQVRGLTPHVPNHAPMTHLEIPLFDGSKLRWWIRWCECFFQFYNVAEHRWITLVITCLNDMTDLWFQGWF